MDVSCEHSSSVPHKRLLLDPQREGSGRGRDSATNDDTRRVFVKILFVKEKKQWPIETYVIFNSNFWSFKFREMT